MSNQTVITLVPTFRPPSSRQLGHQDLHHYIDTQLALQLVKHDDDKKFKNVKPKISTEIEVNEGISLFEGDLKIPHVFQKYQSNPQDLHFSKREENEIRAIYSSGGRYNQFATGENDNESARNVLSDHYDINCATETYPLRDFANREKDGDLTSASSMETTASSSNSIKKTPFLLLDQGNQSKIPFNQIQTLKKAPSDIDEPKRPNSVQNLPAKSLLFPDSKSVTRVAFDTQDELSRKLSPKRRLRKNSTESNSVLKEQTDQSEPKLHQTTIPDYEDKTRKQGIESKTSRDESKASKNRVSDMKETLKLEDFEGIGSFCRNIGYSRRGFDRFLNDAMTSDDISISILWKDLTTNHVSSTIKYCTPSVDCRVWHCACNRHIRVHQAYQQLLGAVILLGSDLSVVYFLPLSYCAGSGDEEELTRSSPFSLPLKCEVSYQDRWKLLFQLLNYDKLTKIVYNCPVFMLPILYHAQYFQSISSDVESVQSNQYRSIFDVRIAQYLIKSSTSESGLELASLLSLYSMSLSKSLPTGLGAISTIVYRVKEELNQIHYLFVQMKDILSRTNVLDVFRQIEMPISIMLSDLELRGFQVSLDKIEHIRVNALHGKEKATATAHKISGKKFNVGSPDQIAELLYKDMKIPPSNSATTKRNYSTSEEDLLKIRHYQPQLIDSILAYRKFSKIIGTTIEGIEQYLVKHPIGHDSTSRTGPYRIHAIWNQTATRTGRLSCSNPNLQNVPNAIDDIYGYEINSRSIFRSSDGHILISADYSQIEVRVMAHISQDNELQRLFQQEGDVYKQLASVIFSKPFNIISDSERSKAKTICLGQSPHPIVDDSHTETKLNSGIMYGMGHYSAAQKLNISVDEVKRITSTFFDRFQRLKQWTEETKQFGKVHGYVQTLSGRRRYLESDQTHQSDRQAVNTVIQGTASDILKMAMIKINEKLLQWSLKSSLPKILLQLHDEVIYEMNLDSDSSRDIHEIINHPELERFIELLRDCMENWSNWTIPMPVNVQIGYDWGNMIKYPSSTTKSTDTKEAAYFDPHSKRSVDDDDDGNASDRSKRMKRSVD